MNVQPDKDLFLQAATLKDMKASFVEKDWLVVQVIKILKDINIDGFDIVFSGGTALSKAHNLLFRFSEDIDFRVLVSPELRNRKSLSSFKHAVLDALRAAGFVIEEHHVKARDENRFFAIDLEYETAFPRQDSLRPHIQIEMTARDIQLPALTLPVSSFLNELAQEPPEIFAISCIDPVESTADKLSAIAWRIPDRVRGGEYDDPSIVRHIHDLAMLKDRALAFKDFSSLIIHSMQEDDSRAKNDQTLQGMPIVEKLRKMMTILESDKSYPEEYKRFVEDVSYAKQDQTPDFGSAVSAVRDLIDALH